MTAHVKDSVLALLLVIGLLILAGTADSDLTVRGLLTWWGVGLGLMGLAVLLFWVWDDE